MNTQDKQWWAEECERKELQLKDISASWNVEVAKDVAFKVAEKAKQEGRREMLEECIKTIKESPCQNIKCSEHWHRFKDKLKSKLTPTNE